MFVHIIVYMLLIGMSGGPFVDVDTLKVVGLNFGSYDYHWDALEFPVKNSVLLKRCLVPVHYEFSTGNKINPLEMYPEGRLVYDSSYRPMDNLHIRNR